MSNSKRRRIQSINLSTPPGSLPRIHSQRSDSPMFLRLLLGAPIAGLVHPTPKHGPFPPLVLCPSSTFGSTSFLFSIAGLDQSSPHSIQPFPPGFSVATSGSRALGNLFAVDAMASVVSLVSAPPPLRSPCFSIFFITSGHSYFHPTVLLATGLALLHSDIRISEFTPP